VKYFALSLLRSVTQTLPLTKTEDDFDHDKYPYTKASDLRFKNCKEPFEDNFKNIYSAMRPFKMVTKKNTKQVALLLHGLSDSPYYMKDIAMSMARAGINVVAIRLSGHGTVPEALHQIDEAHWMEDVNFGLKQAAKHGDEIIMVGLSTGASLIVNTITDMAKYDYNISKALLISPALKLHFPEYIFTWDFMKNQCRETKFYGRGVRYNRIANEGVGALHKINTEIREKRDDNHMIEIPVMAIFGHKDDLVNLPQADSLIRELSGNLYTCVLAGDSSLNDEHLLQEDIHINKEDSIDHMTLLLREQGFAGIHEVNPNFEEFENVILDFVKTTKRTISS